MNSPTHSLLALAALSKRGHSLRNWAVFIGSIIPDIAIYIWAPWQNLINGVSGRELWRELYFEGTMQALIAPPNSIPLFMLIAIIGFIKRANVWGMAALMLALAALIHIATDFPVHGHDAYRHFWPLTDWRFHSPLSYWQASHGGRWVSLFESGLALVCITVLWKRFPKLWVKITLSAFALAYIALQLIMWLAPSGAAH